jgi:protease-4
MNHVLLVTVLLVSLSATGCKQPLRVVTQICASTLPVRISADDLPPLHIKSDEVPVNVKTEIPALPLKDAEPLAEMVVQPGDANVGKIAVIDIDGLLLNKNATALMSAGENPVALFREKLDTVESHASYRGVVLRINSPGGGVTATDIMRRDLIRFRDRTGLPVVACLMDVGAGGAYSLATAADQIVAHPTSLVGGLGVILNLYNLEDTLAMLNIVGTPVRAGQHVDLGTPVRMMSEDARAILQDIANKFHERLRADITSSRADLGSDDALFDGRVFTADDAMQRGLVDRLGYLDDAIDACRSQADCPSAGVVILHRPRDSARTPYAVTPNLTVQAGLFPHLPGVNRTNLPTFMYIWQPDPAIETSLGN